VLHVLLSSGCVWITQQDVRDRDAKLNPPAPPAPAQPGSAVIRVLDERGVLVPAALVSLTGSGPSVVGRTDVVGTTRFTDLAPGWWTVSVNAAGRPPGGAALEIADDQSRVVQVRLARTRVGTVHRPATGGAITRDGEFALVFDDGAFEGAPNQPLALEYAWAEPGGGTAPAPWALSEARPTPVELVAAAWIGTSSAGREMTGSGVLRIPAPPGDPLRQLTAPTMYHFDASTGLWRSEGEATLEDWWLSGPFTAPGWWAIGSSGDTLGCLQGEVTADGAPVAGALVEVHVPGRPAHLTSWADGAGRYCAATEPGAVAQVEVLGESADGSKRYEGAAPLPLATSIAVCGGSCGGVDPIALARTEDVDGDGSFGGVWGDCADRDPDRSPAAIDFPGDTIDQNCDGADGVDADRDGKNQNPDEDCDDADPSSYKGAVEVCDGVDNDCDDYRDNGVPGSITLGGGQCRECDAQVVIDLGPKLYWSFRELGETTPDSSGYGFDGITSGLTTSLHGVSEETGSAPWFSGTRDTWVGLETFGEMGTYEWTVSAFLRPSLTRRTWFSYALPAPTEDLEDCLGNTVQLAINPNGELRVSIRDVLARVTDPPTRMDAWQHVAVTWRSDATVQVYVNGVVTSTVLEYDTEDGSTGGTCEFDESVPVGPFLTTVDPGGSVFVGQDQDRVFRAGVDDAGADTSQAFQGLIDEIAVFDRVLSSDEIELMYRAVTCGEGLACDGVDQDGDGLVDEHLLGTDGGACAAPSCDAILENDAWAGDGRYWVSFEEDVFYTRCLLDGAACECQICGDGRIQPPSESCEDPSGLDPTCRSCTIETGVAPTDCEAVLLAGHADDATYWVTLPSMGVPLPMRCDQTQDGGGWSLVYELDTQTGALFYDPDDAAHTTSTGSGLDWRGANSGAPFAGAYSLLGLLDDFSGPCGFDFRLVYPDDDGKAYVWRQAWNPTRPTPAPQPPIEWIGEDVPTRQPFDGLHRSLDTVISINDADGYYYTTLMNSGFTRQRPEVGVPWYAVGLYGRGAQFDTAWPIPASTDVSPDGTVRRNQLWVRACR
jgi:hypothetical protein